MEKIFFVEVRAPVVPAVDRGEQLPPKQVANGLFHDGAADF